jgi:CHAT domain-containing protein
MVGFHRNLAKGELNKAESLREAQLAMIREDPFIHPYLWAPFILIGDWK